MGEETTEHLPFDCEALEQVRVSLVWCHKGGGILKAYMAVCPKVLQAHGSSYTVEMTFTGVGNKPSQPKCFVMCAWNRIE